MNPCTSTTLQTIHLANLYVFTSAVFEYCDLLLPLIQEELEYDPHVNVSFYDPSTTNWISVSGTAKLSTDPNLVKQYWNASLKAWFGDLGDGVHKGDENDPRVSVIEVVLSK
jgi:general stress protein 26